MTKFERAKRQTIMKWEWLLENYYESGHYYKCPSCGFCDEHKWYCGECPIYFIEADSCLNNSSFYHQINSERASFTDILAVLIYVHQLQDPAH